MHYVMLRTEPFKYALTENLKVTFTSLFLHLPLLLLLLLLTPGNGGTPFKVPRLLLPRDGAPLRDDSPPAAGLDA